MWSWLFLKKKCVQSLLAVFGGIFACKFGCWCVERGGGDRAPRGGGGGTNMKREEE